MQETKHTPGPWRQHPNGLGGATTMIWRNDPDQSEGTNKGYAMICKHVHGVHNARLIAAAPELLEALQAALPHLPSVNQDGMIVDSGIKADVRAAIAKATGA